MTFLKRCGWELFRFVSLVLGVFALTKMPNTVHAQEGGTCYKCRDVIIDGVDNPSCLNIAFGDYPPPDNHGYTECTLNQPGYLCYTYGAPCVTVS